MNQAKAVLTDFLRKYCPNPSLIEASIERLGLWDVREFAPDEHLCRTADRAEACWLILAGQAEVIEDGRSITFRTAGEMVGEQGLLTTLVGNDGQRTADIIVRGGLKAVCFGAGLQDKMTPEERAAWSLTLAAVVNEKLAQATTQRAAFRRSIEDRDALLARFADGDALAIVRRAVEEDAPSVVSRDVVIWFSDIANFSTWAADKAPEEVARLARTLTGIQIELIRAANGQIDKLIGDGVMAVWFVDASAQKRRASVAAVECAVKAAAQVNAFLTSEGVAEMLAIRIGLHYGQAMFGDFGAKERIAVTVLGHDVNLASRYEQAKQVDLAPVRVSQTLKELVDASPGERE